jgi:hypothetical protein
MKKIIFIIIAFLSLYLRVSGGYTDVNKNPNLPFTSAVIKYEYEGGRSGSETVYIDLEANKIAIETSVSTTFKGITDTDKTLKIYDGKVAYSVNFGRRQAIKVTKEGDIVSEMFGEERFSDYYTGETNLLGNTCKVYQSPLGTFYFWHGIILREELTVPLMRIKYTKEAKSIELNTSISPEKFRLPSGVKVTTTEELKKKFEQKFKNFPR